MRNYQGQANSIAATIRRTPTPSPKSEDELQHLRRKPKMSPHSPLRNPKTNPHSLAATMTNSNSLTTTLRRTPTPSPQPQGYEVTELESRCEQKIFAKWEVGLETLLFESAARFGTQQTKRELTGRPRRRDRAGRRGHQGGSNSAAAQPGRAHAGSGPGYAPF